LPCALAPKVAEAAAAPRDQPSEDRSPRSSPSRWPKRRVELEAAAIGSLALIVYAAGACPTIYVGDSGELVAAVDVLGIPHPSGYPLYVLLGKLWTVLLPLGSVAYRMSLFSAVCAAAACAVLHHLCRRSGLGAPAAAFSALLLAVSPSLWGEANVQRVYALNLLFVMLAVWWAFEWWRTGRDRALLVACLLCGLGAANHTFLGFVAIAIGIFALAARPGLLRRPRFLLAMPACALAGLLPYAYLPIRSSMDPPLDWGNPETLEGFLGVVLRRDFWDRKWIEGPADLLVIGADYLKSLGSELLWLGAALMLVGLVAGRRRWPVLLPVLIMAANAGAMAAHGSRSDIFIWHRYYVPSYAMAALLAGMGLQALLDRLALAPRLRPLAWAPLAVPLAGLLLHWSEFDRSRYRVADDFSRKLLGTLPPGAHIAATDDNILFVLIYLKFVEGLRPDVDLILQGVGGANLPNLRFNPDNEGLFFTHHPNWRHQQLAVVPVGLVFQVARAGTVPPLRLPAGPLEGADDPRVPKDYLTQNLIGQWHYMLGSTFESRDWRLAQAEFDRAARAAPENDVLFYNLGLIYSGNGLYQEALAAFERSHQINPRHIASRERVRPIDKVMQARAEVERLREVESRLSAGLPPAGTAAYHRALAERLAAAGEEPAARGHLLRALTAGN
jgi:tetratricopeptide (TPR) repeat protein